MPLKNYYSQVSNGCVDLATLRRQNNPASDVFSKDFSANMDVEEWNDWMSGEYDALSLDCPLIYRRESTASTISWGEDTSVKVESIGNEAAFSNKNQVSFEDVPFKQQLAPKSFHALAVGQNSNQQVPRSSNVVFTLTEAEERRLIDIAMPCHIFTQVKKSPEPSSPVASCPSPSPSPSPKPRTRKRKNAKRKPSSEDKELNTALCHSRKTGHNLIEKRYRTKLNEKIDCLRRGIPSPRRQSSSGLKSGDEGENSDEEEENNTGQKYGKAMILTQALEYIKHLENTTQRLGGEIEGLKGRVIAFEKLRNGSVLGENLSVPNEVLLTMSETLESTKADFTRITSKDKLDSARTKRRKALRQAKAA